MENLYLVRTEASVEERIQFYNSENHLYTTQMESLFRHRELNGIKQTFVDLS